MAENERKGKKKDRTEWAVVDDRTLAQRPYAGETYYGRPAVKKTHYRWSIAGYLFSGGLAGAAQIIATLADLADSDKNRQVVRAGRYLALAGSVASPILLIVDLHTPQRWYNMLRIFRKSSPMSIGSWTLTSFGTLSGLVAVSQAAADVTGIELFRKAARVASIPAAGTGMVMAVYTAPLLSTTNVPLWTSIYRVLPAIFGSTATATATAAISLAVEPANLSESQKRPLEVIGLVATCTELVTATIAIIQLQQQKVDEPLKKEPVKSFYRIGFMGLGAALPFTVHALSLLGWRSKPASIIASMASLAGGFVDRSVLVFAGNDSADRPEDYFRVTQRHPNGQR